MEPRPHAEARERTEVLVPGSQVAEGYGVTLPAGGSLRVRHADGREEQWRAPAGEVRRLGFVAGERSMLDPDLSSEMLRPFEHLGVGTYPDQGRVMSREEALGRVDRSLAATLPFEEAERLGVVPLQTARGTFLVAAKWGAYKVAGLFKLPAFPKGFTYGRVTEDVLEELKRRIYGVEE
jgi:hypothetical protein